MTTGCPARRSLSPPMQTAVRPTATICLRSPPAAHARGVPAVCRPLWNAPRTANPLWNAQQTANSLSSAPPKILRSRPRPLSQAARPASGRVRTRATRAGSGKQRARAAVRHPLPRTRPQPPPKPPPRPPPRPPRSGRAMMAATLTGCDRHTRRARLPALRMGRTAGPRASPQRPKRSRAHLRADPRIPYQVALEGSHQVATR